MELVKRLKNLYSIIVVSENFTKITSLSLNSLNSKIEEGLFFVVYNLKLKILMVLLFELENNCLN